ncbi:DUF2878 family protein [Candidatus Woesearchaeota archaeon]|nr:DUF2878 family protein [Candidatus Woesearchaeota archaeon]
MRRIKKELFYELFIFVLCIFFIVLLWRQNIYLTLILIALYIAANRFWHKEHEYIFYIIGAILGPVAEIISISFGVWSYANPTFLGIPLWLPFIWGLAAVMITRIAETFVKITKHSA